MIARFESPSYLMVAVTKESGLTDLHQVLQRKMPVRILGNNATVLDYYGLTPKAVESLGGKFFAGNNLFKISPNATSLTTATIATGTPGTTGYGTINSGFLEMSNVDLSTQFTNMIIAQRGFQANSRVITTSDEILQDLVNIKH